ncbi:MAG: Lar family restriction alleviation protein [Firmicutes bacterium]|nr:Lar family restriction alleviation protein [Bacillota bacterium]
MKVNYTRPSGCKNPGYDSPEVEQVIVTAEQAATNTAAVPCPFCGGQPEISIHWMYHFSAAVAIRCENCKIGTNYLPIGAMTTGHVYTMADRVEQAAAQWNQRQD